MLPWQTTDPKQLHEISTGIRKSVVTSLAEARSGHLGGSLGLADIFTTIYFSVLTHDPQNPSWPGRDRLILSIGHVAPVLYATLAHSGYFPVEELDTLRKLGSRLQGHPGRDHGLPGLELSAGSLGQGLSVAVGMAIAAKIDELWVSLMKEYLHFSGNSVYKQARNSGHLIHLSDPDVIWEALCSLN